MKKFLNLLAQTFLISGTSLTIVGCHNPLASGSDEPAVPSKPIGKDVQYYQDLIRDRASDIIDYDEMLEEIKASKSDYDDEKDYQADLDEMLADQFHLKVEISEYRYQILLLEQPDGKFDADQIIVGIAIFTAKVNNLNQELELKQKHYKDYEEKEIQLIESDIATAEKLLQQFIDLKGD